MIIENPIVIDIKDDVKIEIKYGGLTYHVSAVKLLDAIYKEGYAYITVDEPTQIP